ncbi:hypothetical protein R9X50_00365300 [Acrodontium crateriforme]|uniref:Cytochrome P450 n=1 Tax=Acrodontium crateriforme TaxID=150365 RepID=A0AAQ3RC16_9PEZI|nr:hypothetical protein R9X50_00365300 [Acrodontium crateriforme]
MLTPMILLIVAPLLLLIVAPLLLLIVAPLLLFIWAASVILKPGLTSVPGPWLAKISNLYRIRMVQRGRFSYELVELHRKYGPAVRIGPDCVSLTDRRLIKDIYGYRTDFIKSDWVKSSQTLYNGKVVPALMTTQDKGYHAAMKRAIASAYSVTTLQGYETSVEDTVRLFLQKLDDLYAKRAKRVLSTNGFSSVSCIRLGQEKTTNANESDAYDVIGAVTMSRSMGLLEQGTDVDNMLKEIQVEAEYRAVGAVMPLIDYVYRKNGLVTMFAAPTYKIMIRARRMLHERLQDRTKEKHPGTLNDRNMMGFVGSNLQAGSDTTAIVLRTILYHALKTPEIVTRMQNELDAPGVTHPISFQQAFNELPYVNGVIQEAIRIFPPFALLLERMVPALGLELPDGTVLPENTKVGMFEYTMHLDKEIYGSDAEKFNPERWIRRAGEDEVRFKERYELMKASDMSFGHGQRRCVGVHVAELQIYKLIPALIGLLDIELENPEEEWQIKQKFFALQSNINVKIKWREGKSLGNFAKAEKKTG